VSWNWLTLSFDSLIIIIIIIILSANRHRKVQQQRRSTRSNRKLTMAPAAAAIWSMSDLVAQLTTRWNQLYVGFWWGRKTGEPGEKPLKQRREPTQTQPTNGIGSGIGTQATLVGGECSHHCAIPASLNGFISFLLESQVWLKCLWRRWWIWNVYFGLPTVQAKNSHVSFSCCCIYELYTVSENI